MATSQRYPTHSVNNIGGLTLPAGMTAGIGSELVENAQYWPGQYGDPHPSWWSLKRPGIMRTIPGYSAQQAITATTPTGTNPASTNNTLPGQEYKLHFLYNPNEIQTAFQVDISQLPTPAVSTSGVPTVPNAATGQTVSWSLYFDRTYDLMNNPGASRGVLQDVAALYNITGFFSTYGNSAILNPVQVVFGQDTTGSGAIWGFTGFIVGINITYGTFRFDMMPSRCEIDLLMMTRYLPQSVPSSDPGTGESLALHAQRPPQTTPISSNQLGSPIPGPVSPFTPPGGSF